MIDEADEFEADTALSKSELNCLVMRLDLFMNGQPEGRWVLDGDYWKSYHYDDGDTEEVECYSYIDRRLLSDGGVVTGYTFLEGGHDNGESECIPYNSIDDMLIAEFGDA